MTRLGNLLPFIKRPLITVPPMAFVTRADLTIATAQAGALGFLACGESLDKRLNVGYDIPTFTNDLSLVLTALHSLDIPHVKNGFLPFGVGFLMHTTPIEILNTVFPEDGVTPHPSAIWLFVGAFEKWIPIIRQKSPETVIFVQVGSVDEGRRAVKTGADIIVAQGIDAGGHGVSNSASIISLVPEMVTTLPQTPILAAGGIVDAKGVLAALTLGADGVVIGTRFATSEESAMADNAKSLILNTTDGGVSTKRTQLYDNLRGVGGWQKVSTYNGRAIINDTLREYGSGVSEEALKKKYAVATKEGDYSRLVVYAGTGSGLITKKQTVKEILDEIEKQLAEEVNAFNARFGGH